jgi:2-amino-4-hydroxy-6-hydroxymethyldihydropteridine diphosphokinase
MKKMVYLSLGSNLGDREAQIREAIAHLQKLGEVTSVSASYETEPVEVEREQPWYLNCAVAIETELPSPQFLTEMLGIEKSMGRNRAEPRGPRTIDIDIVFFGDDVLDTPELTVPHPAMQQRRFVLEPLAEIAPDMVHPVLKQKVRQLLRSLPENSGSVSKLQPN